MTYTHADVELVARALYDHPGDTPFDYYDDAKRALDALATAGRLAPPLPDLPDDPVARRLGLFNGEGRAVCRCPAGACQCRPAAHLLPLLRLTADEVEALRVAAVSSALDHGSEETLRSALDKLTTTEETR